MAAWLPELFRRGSELPGQDAGTCKGELLMPTKNAKSAPATIGYQLAKQLQLAGPHVLGARRRSAICKINWRRGQGGEVFEPVLPF
jgi:hypothetical protein